MLRFFRRRESRRALWSVLWLFCVTPVFAEGQDKPIGEAPEERAAEDIFLRGQRVLLGRGDVVLDIGQFYSRSDTLQLAVIDNALQLATNEQSVLTTVLVGRVGVLNETEVYAGASYYHLESRLVAAATDLAGVGRNIVGDVSIGVRRVLLREAAGRPDIIATIDAQIPTDDDRVTVLGGGLAFVKSIDPVVLFASSSFQHGFRRTLPDGRRLAPGNAFTVSLGYGLALNDSVAISTAASGVFTRASFVETVGSGRAETFSLRFALTSALTRRLFIEPSVTVALSGPGQSFTMGITVPYSF
jgi:hypothetical protein